jgi:hypothetical protein
MSSFQECISVCRAAAKRDAYRIDLTSAPVPCHVDQSSGKPIVLFCLCFSSKKKKTCLGSQKNNTHRKVVKFDRKKNKNKLEPFFKVLLFTTAQKLDKKPMCTDHAIVVFWVLR